jgi:putative transposase
MLRLEGSRDNHKNVYRLYRKQVWSLRQKRPKRNKAAQLRQPKKLALHINQIWSMDFVADNLFDARKLRILKVVDCFTRESLDIHVDKSLKGEDVPMLLNNTVAIRGKPMTLKTDNGSEFISKVMDKWAYYEVLSWTSADRVSPSKMPWR